MATTQEVLAAARDLGELIAKHEAAQKVEEVMKKLEADVEAQRLLNDLNRHVATLAEKESSNQPIEVEDKRKLETLQGGVSRNVVLRDFQMVQMDYVDLMRKVDQAISDRGDRTPAASTSKSPIVTPGTS